MNKNPQNMTANLKGVLIMTLSMALLTSGDAAIKIYSELYSQPVLMTLLGGALFVLFASIAWFRGEAVFTSRSLSGPPVVRSVAEILAVSIMVFALYQIPFTVITFMMQAMPLIVTLGAVAFFGETVGWKRWSAILLGFAGVAIVLRPWHESFDVTWLLAVGVAVVLSARDLATRGVPKDISTVQISAWGGIAISAAGFFAFMLGDEPFPQMSEIQIVPLLIILTFWSSGVYAVSVAMRMGDVSVIAPFRYTRLPFGLLVGAVIFQEHVDSWMILGVLIVVASGLFILKREAAAR